MSKQVSSQVATKQAPKAAPAKKAPKAKPNAQQLHTYPTLAQAPVVAAPVVAAPVAPATAVRGGLVFTTVAQVPGKVYRTKAPHNVAWWNQIAKATANGPAPVAAMLVSATNPGGVPVAFLGYCVRRGYLAAA